MDDSEVLTANLKKAKEILSLDETFWHCYSSIQLSKDLTPEKEGSGDKESASHLAKRLSTKQYLERRQRLLLKKLQHSAMINRSSSGQSAALPSSSQLQSWKHCSYWNSRMALLQRKCERRREFLENCAIVHRVESSLMAAVFAQEAEDQVYRETKPPPGGEGRGDRAMIESMLEKTDAASIGTPHFRHVFHLESPVCAVRFTHGATQLCLVGLEDGRVMLFEYHLEAAAPPQQLTVLKAHKGPLIDAQWSIDNRTLLTISKDSTMKIWAVNPENKDQSIVLQNVAFLANQPVSVAFCSIYSSLAFVAHGSILSVISLQTPPVSIQEFQQNAPISAMVISENNTELFLGLTNGQILVYALEEDPEFFQQSPIIQPMQGSFAFGVAVEQVKVEKASSDLESPVESPLITSVKRWAQRNPVGGLFSGQKIYAAYIEYRKFDYHLGHPILFAVDNNTNLWRLKVAPMHNKTHLSLLDSWLAPAESTGITALCSFPHSEAIACGTADRHLKIFQPNVSRQGEQQHKATVEIKGHHSAALTQVFLNDDGSFMVSADKNGDVVLWKFN